MNELAVENAKRKIKAVIQEGLDQNIISQSEFLAMSADDKDPARFYCNFKVHKEHAHKQPPPPRPIISGSESLTDNIGTYLEHHIKDITKKPESYLQDTPDFLRTINHINKGPKLNERTVLVTIDAIGLFTNIVHEEGLQCLKDSLEKRNNPEVPTNFLLQLMQLILTNNIFVFHDALWKQNIGAAMGSRPVPSYADNCMAKLDKIIKALEGAEDIKLLKKF